MTKELKNRICCTYINQKSGEEIVTCMPMSDQDSPERLCSIIWDYNPNGSVDQNMHYKGYEIISS